QTCALPICTNWSAASRTSSSLVGGVKLWRTRMLRHMRPRIIRGPDFFQSVAVRAARPNPHGSGTSGYREAVTDARPDEAHHDDAVVALTQQLIAIDSVSPSLAPGHAGEAGIAAFVGERLERAGYRVEAVPSADPARPSIVAVRDGS